MYCLHSEQQNAFLHPLRENGNSKLQLVDDMSHFDAMCDRPVLMRFIPLFTCFHTYAKYAKHLEKQPLKSRFSNVFCHRKIRESENVDKLLGPRNCKLIFLYIRLRVFTDNRHFFVHFLRGVKKTDQAFLQQQTVATKSLISTQHCRATFYQI